ncbi:22515_t:CDS:2 [Cetraspora pellucida]|uniref:22515_t:CDS:1 n=1 Tax=Cetraspora pellucida TaxID=1433469 RepID=A0A9N9DI80_9GLOM|nr:22515_t:CDS:2 [Cetraspora pellucida]
MLNYIKADHINNKGLPIRNIAANLQLAASTVQSIVNTFDKEDQILCKSWSAAIHKVVNNRGKNISVIAAINKNGVLHYKSILAMDNISFHRSDVVKETVANTTHQLLYLPAYSSFLNPIENCFLKLKDSVARNHLRGRETILSRMNNEFNIVTEEDCIG